MKVKLFFILCLLVSGCAKDGKDGSNGINGRDGLDGRDGENGTIFTSVDPCGDGPGPDELVLIFSDGSVMAWYKNLGLTELDEGVTYTTTDKQRCKFTINNGTVEEL